MPHSVVGQHPCFPLAAHPSGWAVDRPVTGTRCVRPAEILIARRFVDRQAELASPTSSSAIGEPEPCNRTPGRNEHLILRKNDYDGCSMDIGGVGDTALRRAVEKRRSDEAYGNHQSRRG